jgi:tetratricopeptide (TPR) repeat protein
MRSNSFIALAFGAALLTGCASTPPPKPKATSPAASPVAAAAAPASKPALAAAAKPAGAYAEALKLMKAHQLAEAEAALLAVAAARPDASGPATNLGILYAKSNRKPQAREAFARAVALNPANAVAHTWAGVLAREAGDFTLAERSYRAALEADPAHADAALNLAFLYDLYLKRPADALAAYKRYDQLNGRKDARVAVWIDELEARVPAARANTGATS